jgi:hypothetical protein
VYPYAHPQHLKLLKHFVYIQYGCGIQSMGVYSVKSPTLQHHTGSAIPHFSLNSPPPAHVIQHKCVPICPSTASQVAKTLCIHPIWLWDAVNGCFQPQTICPSTASQAAKILCIHPIWMWDAVNGGLQPQKHDTPTSYMLRHTPFFLKFTPTCTCNTA